MGLLRVTLQLDRVAVRSLSSSASKGFSGAFKDLTASADGPPDFVVAANGTALFGASAVHELGGKPGVCLQARARLGPRASLACVTL